MPHVSIREAWSVVWGTKSTKPPTRGDGTEQTGQKLNKLQITLFPSYKLLLMSAAHVITVVKRRHQNYSTTNLHCS